MVRPPAKRKLTERLEVRLASGEKAQIEDEAYKAALTVSDYIRKRALGIRIVSRYDDHVLNELRRLGGLQKHLASQYPKLKIEFNAVLMEITEAIKRLG